MDIVCLIPARISPEGVVFLEIIGAKKDNLLAGQRMDLMQLCRDYVPAIINFYYLEYDLYPIINNVFRDRRGGERERREGEIHDRRGLQTSPSRGKNK